jgi:sugar phosphate isomerase/epimerase
MAGIGIAIGTGGVVRGQAAFAPLRALLAEVAALGYSHAELGSAKSLGLIVGGRLQPQRLAALREAVADSPMRLTLHGSAVSSTLVGNLMDVAGPIQRAIVAADLALAAAIGAEVLVYHRGMPGIPYADGDALALALRAEREALRELGDEAGRHGIRIAVENVHPTETRLRHQASFDLEALGEHVAQINHPQVGICLDTGHGFLSSRFYGFDFLAQIRTIAPLVNHIHLTDNLGRPLIAEDMDPDESLALGLGDLHLLPGWGTIPLTEVFSNRFPGEPIITLEIRGAFLPHASEALAATRALQALIPEHNAALVSNRSV